MIVSGGKISCYSAALCTAIEHHRKHAYMTISNRPACLGHFLQFFCVVFLPMVCSVVLRLVFMFWHLFLFILTLNITHASGKICLLQNDLLSINHSIIYAAHTYRLQ